MFPSGIISILLLTVVCLAKSEDVIIGGVFDENDEFHQKVFEYTVGAINKEEILPAGKNMLSMMTTVPRGNSFATYNQLCYMLGSGSVGVFGPIAETNSKIIKSVCEAKDIPHLEFRMDGTQKRGHCHVNFYPHPSSLGQAYVDMIRSYEWKSFTILYENNDSYYRLAKVLKMYDEKGYLITVRQLDLGLGNNNYRDILYKIKQSGETNILLDCSIVILNEVLKQAQQVGLLSDLHNLIITNLDMHTIDLEPYQYGGTNISGIRMVDPSDPLVIDTVRSWNEASGENEEKYLDPSELWLQAALMVDAMYSYASVLNELNFTKFTNYAFDCNDEYPWEYGTTVTNFIKMKERKGLTGNIKFDNEGFRTEFKLDIIELTSSGINKVGVWDGSDVDFQRVHTDSVAAGDHGSLANKTFIVLTAISAPYGMLKKTTARLEGNDRYEGFGIELIDELSKMLGFNYTFQIQEDGVYGSKDKKTKEWNGMLRKIMDGEADFAITDLTVNSDREEAVDFTMPFMNLGISILYKKPTKASPSLFSFMSPFSNEVWLYLGTSYLGVSLLMFILARISPKEWNNPYPCIEEPETLVNQFSLPNSLWFTIGSVLQQGSELAPIAISTRMMAGIWWFFTLIMVSSYTANLAAFLTVQSTLKKIENVYDLANQDVIKYGAKASGATYDFFRDSDDETFQKMYKYMLEHPTNMIKYNPDGVKKVLKDDYAFFMESTSIEYEVERKCELAQVGGLLDDKGYAIAMKKNSPYRNQLSEAVLLLQERGKLTSMKNKWWKERDGGGSCPTTEESSGSATALGIANVAGVFLVLIVGTVVAIFINFIDMMSEIYYVSKQNKTAAAASTENDLKMDNVGGVFFVLACGSFLACFIAVGEWISGIIHKSKEFKISFKEELKEEMKFLAQWSGDTKPVRHRTPGSKSLDDVSRASESNKSKNMIKNSNLNVKMSIDDRA